ncbi:hypothetical protein ACCI51_09650 [Microbulbifer echini]|uniref:Uncharacterized protein n=1 Tax=Microbulbifer echini TaxID=1529067 RepID=A0ABV4NMN7_9GAMM|nr:hypothetical protein [uncultured Microbulbifer sp.]
MKTGTGTTDKLNIVSGLFQLSEELNNRSFQKYISLPGRNYVDKLRKLN